MALHSVSNSAETLQRLYESYTNSRIPIQLETECKECPCFGNTQCNRIYHEVQIMVQTRARGMKYKSKTNNFFSSFNVPLLLKYITPTSQIFQQCLGFFSFRWSFLEGPRHSCTKEAQSSNEGAYFEAKYIEPVENQLVLRIREIWSFKNVVPYKSSV